MTSGRVSPVAALVFALLLALAGQLLLLAFTNPLTAWLTLASLIGYAAIYTGFLKRATPQNIVIGGLAGAAPPLLGWVAVSGHLGAEPLPSTQQQFVRLIEAERKRWGDVIRAADIRVT